MTKEKVNPTFDDFGRYSRKQIELAMFIRQYRRIHEISLRTMAEICNIYGKRDNVTFTFSDISNYENYKTIPTPPKFQILMKTMDITPAMLK